MVLAAHPKHKQSVHDKKRFGQHHKPGKSYTKTYWPYLPMLLVVLCGFVLNLSWHPGQAVLGYATDVSPYGLLDDTNIQRTQNGETALALNNQLASAAQAKANDMVAKDYWAHVSPNGTQPWQFIAAAGYSYASAGENLAYGFDTSAATVAGWMNSAEHRANILDTGFQDVGFGIANSPNFNGSGEETVVVAMYGQPQKVVSPSIVKNGTTTPAPASTPAPAAQSSAPTPTPATQPVQPATQPAAATPKSTTTTQTASTPTAANPNPRPIAAQPVSRIDVLTNGNAQWAALALSALATICIINIIIKHARMWRRYLIKGEVFFIKHPLLDTIFVAIGVLGFVLTRASGFIQ
jgi:Cysteine-rich secretory protein family